MWGACQGNQTSGVRVDRNGVGYIKQKGAVDFLTPEHGWHGFLGNGWNGIGVVRDSPIMCGAAGKPGIPVQPEARKRPEEAWRSPKVPVHDIAYAMSHLKPLFAAYKVRSLLCENRT